MIVENWWTIVERRTADRVKPNSSQKYVSQHPFIHHISQGLTWDRTHVSVVRRQRLTTRALARPFEEEICTVCTLISSAKPAVKIYHLSYKIQYVEAV